jgi:phosphatidylethanolamine/phosphatidyl-N-methylethanolamine N-methyltransferase
MLKDLRLFYSECRNNFATVGAIAPSSPLLAKAIILPLQHRPRRPIAVLEAGAGTGSFTHRILNQLRFGDRLDIYELNPKFYSFLRRSLRKAKLSERGIQCRLHNADVRTLRKGTQYDFIISGLPLNNFDSRTVSEILQTYLDHLCPTGVLSYFEYFLTQEFKSKFLKPTERDRLIQVAKTVGKFIAEYQYSCYQVWWNLPPAKARHFRKMSNLMAGCPKEHLNILE